MCATATCFADHSFLSRTKVTWSALTTAAGPYLQHQPPLVALTQGFVKHRLNIRAYPSAMSAVTHGDKLATHVYIVFVVGGITFEELRHLADLKLPIVLGGSCIHNSRSFLLSVL